MKAIFKSLSLPILSGIFIGTSYIPFPPWAILFCLTPLWVYWTQNDSYKKVFIGGWVTQFILNLIGFHWVAHTAVEFGNMPWPGGLGVLAIFCSFAHLYYPIAGVLWLFICKKLKVSKPYSIILIPIVFALVERLYPFIFLWHLGYTWLWASLPGYHLAEWIGFYGLNFFTLICNMMMVLFWLSAKPLSKRLLWSTIGMFVLVNLAGLFVGRQVDLGDRKLHVVAVQGNIGNLMKKQQPSMGRMSLSVVVDTFIDLSKEQLEKQDQVDLLVWPETAFPETIYENRQGYYLQRVKAMLREYQVDLFTGAYQRDLVSRKPYNSVVLITRDGRVVDSYKKTHLLAYGEYFPGATYFPKLKEWFPEVSDFGRGGGPKTIAYGPRKLGTQICYEGLFDHFSCELQKQGAQILVNVTNDSWFGWPSEPYQHMYMTLARAIENRLPLVRVTNTGISTAILADGTILEQSPRDKKWAAHYEIPYSERPNGTFYAKIVGLWPYFLLALLMLVLGGERLARARKH